MIEALIIFPTGIAIATIVTAFGLGGGILWLPFFLIILDLQAETAVITSLMIQIAGLGSGSLAYIRESAVDYRLAFFLVLISVPGVLAGAYISYTVEPASLELILGLLVMGTAFLFVSANEAYEDTGQKRASIKKAAGYAWLQLGLSVGSGMLSIGIGEWLVPIMQNRLALRMRNAIATCIFVTFAMFVAGTVIHFSLGGVADLGIAAAAIPGVMIGGQIGPAVTRRINQRLLKDMFIFLLTLIGIHLMYNAY